MTRVGTRALWLIVAAVTTAACASLPPTGTLAYPSDLRVVTPSASVAPERAAFSGHWIGTWEVQGGVARALAHALVVEQVEDTWAIVVFSGTAQSGQSWGRHRAQFVDGALRFSGSRGTVATYRVQPDGTLFATMEYQGKIFRSRMTRRP